MNLKDKDVEMCIDLVINSDSGYYDDTIENGNNILIGKEMFTWSTLGHTEVTSEYIQLLGKYKLHSGTDVGAPVGACFVAMANGIVKKDCCNG